MRVLKYLVVMAAVLATACSSQGGPRLVEPDETAEVVEEPTPTPTPEDLLSGRWVSIISQTISQDAGDLRIDVKQLRFSTPERLLPDLTAAQITEYGVVGFPSLIAVRINVENLGTESEEFNPSGFGNVLLVRGVETRPIFALTGEAVSLAAGEKEGFLMVFPVTFELGDVQELTYTVRGLSYNYTELNVKAPS